MVQLDGDLRKALLAKADLDELEALLRRKAIHHSRTATAWRTGVTTQE